MEFSIETAAIQRAVKMLSVVVKANAEDYTGRVLIETKESSVEFSANNGINSIMINVTEINITSPGKISVAYNKIKTFVMSFKPWDGTSGSKRFNFKSNDTNTNISVDNTSESGEKIKGKLRLSNFNTANMILPPRFGEAEFSLNSSVFKTAMNKVLYAINPSGDTRSSYLQGMNIKFDENSVYFAGTDGRVISEYEVKNNTSKKEGNITLHYDFVMGVRRLINDDSQMLFDLNNNKASVKFDDVVFSGRKLMGTEYPNYGVEFGKFERHININKEFLIGFLSPFSEVLDPEDNFRVSLEIKDKVIRLYNDQASMESTQDVEGGIDFSIDVNGKLLLQSIDTIKDDFLLFKFSNANGSLIFDSSKYNNQKSLVTCLRKR